MQKPKKRKLPQSKKTRLNKLRKIAFGNPMEALHRNHLQQDSAILNKIHPLEMAYCEEDSRKVIDSFFYKYDFKVHQAGIVVPELTIIEAYNLYDLIIAIKMQQVVCENWNISVECHYYNLQTDELKTLPYSTSLSGVNYGEIFQELKIKINRGSGIKTRWRGLNKEIDKEHETMLPDGFAKIRTEIHIIGQCKFNSIDAYDEFKYLQGLRDKGILEETFKKIYENAIKNGIYDEKLQPLKHTNDGKAVNVFKEFYMENKPNHS